MSSSSSPSVVSTNVTSTPMSSSAPAPAPPVCRPASKKKVLNLPSGYHFLPTDAELVVHYLRPRLANANHRLPLPIFINERILNYHLDTLIDKYRNYGEDRWFFFTYRERKHSGGNRPNRTTPDNGHWNATGSIRPVRTAGDVLVGCRRTLVFYEASRSRKKKNQPGLPPPMVEEEEDGGHAAKAKDDDVKTEWTMYEYESVNSEAEFQAIRGGGGDANKMDKLVLCTIQKKKNSQEGGEGKKSTKRKTKEEGLELEGMPDGGAGGGVEQGSRAGTAEGQDEDHVQRALMEAAGATKPQVELAYHAHAAGVDNFNNVDPNQNMPSYYLTNSLSPVPIPPQDMLMVPASGDNQIVMHQQNYYIINHSMNMNMKNSQSLHVQETPPQEFLPYLDTKMAAARGGRNAMDHMLQNRFGNMMPSQAPSMSGISTYVNPRRSKSNLWEHGSAELHGGKPNRPLKSEDDWWSSDRQAQLLGRELDNPYVSNSLSFVPTPQQEMMMMELAARGNNQTVMNQRNHLNHSSSMWNSQFHVQATLPQQEIPPCSSTKMAAPPLGGGSAMDHHMLQNRIVNVMPAAEARTFTGFFPGLSSSNYGHLSTRMDHPGPSSVPFPSQQFHAAGRRIGMQGPVLNNQVNLNHQNSAAASMVGYEQRNGVGLAPKIV